MMIDLLTEHDLPAALRLSTQSGWNQLEADWRRLLSLFPQTCFAGHIEGQLVATSTLATFGQTLGWVGMVLVDEAHRGRGLGGNILDAALDAANTHGIQTIGLDATDLGRPVYLKRGFRDVAGIDRWIRVPILHDSRGHKPRIQSARNAGRVPSAIIEKPDVASFDQSATGVDRRALLDLLQRESGVRRGIVGSTKSITGFALLRPGRTADHIGPVVAETEADAVAALEQVLDAPAGKNQPILIDVPRGKLTNWLPTAGFTVARKLTRMCLGVDAPCLLGPWIFAACSFELG